jgi:hypothetical protein
VHKFIQLDSVLVGYGASGATKSLFFLDFALSVAAEYDEWLGRKMNCKNMGVLYIAGEGAVGLRNRVAAWCKVHGIQEPGKLKINIIDEPPNLFLGDADSIIREARAVCLERGWSSIIVIIDTLARTAMGMDENSAKDMGVYVEAAEKLRRALPGSIVIIIHHTARYGTTERGSVALRNGVTTSMQIRGTSTFTKHVTVEKQKDGPEGEVEVYSIDIVELGINGDGDAVTSCVIRPTPGRDVDIPGKRMAAMPATQEAILAMVQALSEQSTDCGIGGAPPETPCITEEALRAAFKTRFGARGSPSYFERAFVPMQRAKLLMASQGWVWLP